MRRVCDRSLVVLAVVLAPWLAGCDRPDVLVMCHNANCAGPPDPSEDDTIASLRESLALTDSGRPTIDGVELDIFWHGEADGGAGRCVFAHDIDTAAESPDATVAAEQVAAHLTEESTRRERFHIRLEIKGSVGSFGDEHDATQLQQHSDCVLDLHAIFVAAAAAADRPLRVIFDSSSPALLHALLERDRWATASDEPLVQVSLSADFIDSTPSGLALQQLDEFPREIDDVVFHAAWISDGHYQAFRSLGLSMTLWMFSATSETFAAIERLEPDAVLTSEAPLLRQWLEY